MKSIIAIMTLLFVVTVGTNAQEQPAGKVHGYLFGDYFYKVSGDSGGGSQYAGYAKKQSAFQLRRVYLFYEHDLSPLFHATFLLEGNDKTVEWSEDKTEKQVSGRYSVFIKLANLEWRDIVKGHNLAAGMVPTPTWVLSEKYWNYRSVEKTVADYRGLGGATDLGMTLRGKFGADDIFGYAVMVGNGSGQKPEDNTSKKYYLSANVKPMKGLIVEAYGDYENKLLNKDKHATMTKSTYKSFVAYQTDKFTAGIEGVTQIQKHAADTVDVKPFAMSVFGWAPLTEKFNAFARYDYYNPDTEVTNTGYTENFMTIGVDYMPIKNVHIMPNLWINKFSKKKSSIAKRDSDVVVRVTLFYVYK